jgi:hypothetical protein
MRRRIVLASITIFFLIFIGYQLYLTAIEQAYDFTVKVLVAGQFEFFPTFTLSSYNIFFATVLIFSICVLPLVFEDAGFLDDNSEESPYPQMEEQVDRLTGFLKSRFGSITKIKNYSLLIGIATAIIGGCLITLPSVFLIDEWVKRVYETGEMMGQEYWYLEKYYGLVRGQLLLVGVLLLVVGVIVAYRFYQHKMGR